MPELYLKIYSLVREGKLQEAREIQDACCHVIYKMCSCKGNMYAVIKGILRERGGPDIGGVRAPLYELQPEDMPTVRELAAEISALTEKYR